jgi:hypothetical protein
MWRMQQPVYLNGALPLLKSSWIMPKLLHVVRHYPGAK